VSQNNIQPQTPISNAFDAIKKAHKLEGNPDKIKQYYEQWSKKYDEDVLSESYCGHDYIVAYFDLLPKQNGKCLNFRNPAIQILDAGCGTGLVGVALHRKGYHNIDGFDLCHSMIEEAEKKQVYRALKGGCDMTKRLDLYPDNYYDAAISGAVFSLGHVPPTGIEEMIRVTKPGGLIVVNTRKSYYDSTNFQEVCDRMQEENKVKLVSYIMDAPYVDEEGAHYWAFQVC